LIIQEDFNLLVYFEGVKFMSKYLKKINFIWDFYLYNI